MSGYPTNQASEIHWGKMRNAPQGETRWRIGQYVRRWKRWVLSGFPNVFGSFEWPIGMPERYVFASNTTFWCKELTRALSAQQPEQAGREEHEGAGLRY
jgi:hypothetical protein